MSRQKETVRLSVTLGGGEPSHDVPKYVARLNKPAETVTSGNSVEIASEDQCQLMSEDSTNLVAAAGCTSSSRKVSQAKTTKLSGLDLRHGKLLVPC